jgi:hypothetical protein
VSSPVTYFPFQYLTEFFAHFINTGVINRAMLKLILYPEYSQPPSPYYAPAKRRTHTSELTFSPRQGRFQSRFETKVLLPVVEVDCCNTQKHRSDTPAHFNQMQRPASNIHKLQWIIHGQKHVSQLELDMMSESWVSSVEVCDATTQCEDDDDEENILFFTGNIVLATQNSQDSDGDMWVRFCTECGRGEIPMTSRVRLCEACAPTLDKIKQPNRSHSYQQFTSTSFSLPSASCSCYSLPALGQREMREGTVMSHLSSACMDLTSIKDFNESEPSIDDLVPELLLDGTCRQVRRERWLQALKSSSSQTDDSFCSDHYFNNSSRQDTIVNNEEPPARARLQRENAVCSSSESLCQSKPYFVSKLVSRVEDRKKHISSLLIDNRLSQHSSSDSGLAISPTPYADGACCETLSELNFPSHSPITNDEETESVYRSALYAHWWLKANLKLDSQAAHNEGKKRPHSCFMRINLTLKAWSFFVSNSLVLVLSITKFVPAQAFTSITAF